MEFSALVLTMYLDRDDEPGGDESVLGAAIEQSLTAAQLGLNPFFTEHHFRGAWHSAPTQFAAYLAPQIPKERYLGFAVISTPMYHPVRLLESMNHLDQLTKGHALFGVGSGFPGIEPKAMGLDVEHHGSGRAADEALEIIERLWNYKNGDPEYAFETPRYRGKIVKRIAPGPYRKLHPTLIATAMRADALQRAAHKGWPIYVGTFGDFNFLLKQLHTYRHALVGAGHPPEVIEECMRWCTYDQMNVVVADSEEEARASADKARDEKALFLENFTLRNSRLALGSEVKAEIGDSASRLRQVMGGGALVGTPDTVAAGIRRVADLGLNHMLLRFMGEWTGTTRPIVEKSMRLFGQEVLPRFKDLAPLKDPLAIELAVPAE
jgi:alkanesulfonate monooxygenase SsuD/methylene tetrahydromethanopterin reductase-like flavin-dependent oxidoreductase (luciferase family)